MNRERPEGGPVFTVEDLLGVLGGRAEWSADGSTVRVTDSDWNGREFEVRLPGALDYVHTFLSRGWESRGAGKSDALSYFDLEIQEFQASLPADISVIIDENGPQATEDVPLPWPLGEPSGSWEAFAINPDSAGTAEDHDRDDEAGDR